MTAALNLQAAIYSVLDTALSVSVYDHVPEDESAIYVVIGEDSDIQSDTKDVAGTEHSIAVDIYSTYRGFKEVKTQIAAIRAALDRISLTVASYSATMCRYQFSDYFMDPKGARGTIRFVCQTYG